MTDILSTISTRATPQSRPADPRQVLNAAGGYVFTVDDMARLKRFLTLGTEGGTYYAGAADLTFDNFDALRRVVATDPRAAVDVVVDVSTRGAAPKQNPALFALAYAAAHGDTAYALSRLPEVARTGTHLFLFAGYVEQFRGWGRGLRRAVAGWYTGKDADDLAYQVVKYRQRGGWSHSDLLRLAHPVSDTPGVAAVLRWVATGDAGDGIPPLVEGFLKAQEPGADIPALVRGYGLSWEMLPTEALDDPKVWDALLDAGVPQTALMRNLPRLTNLGLLPQMGGRTAEVAARLVDPERLQRGRVHPMNVLVAQRTYASGKSLRGTGVWSPTPAITDALDQAFYACLVPETRILTADLRWVSLDDITVGDRIVGVDEEIESHHEPRRMRESKVEAKWEKEAETFTVTFADGRQLTATADHKFLCKKRGRSATEWREVQNMKTGDSVRWITQPWDDPSWEDAWFGGFADGEGTLSDANKSYVNGGVKFSVAQNESPTLDRARSYLTDRRFHFREDAREPNHKGNVTHHLSVSRMDEVIRLLGSTRSTRWADRLWWDGRALPGRGVGDSPWTKVVSVESAGNRRVIDIQTSTRTFIAEGLVTHNCYGAVRPSGKRTLIAVDVSGSMDWTTVGGLPLTPRDAATAMALVTAATEPEYAIVAFCDVLTPLGISPQQRLADAIRETRKLRFGGTDCALPMLWALQQGLQVDTFIVATDSETWAGATHPYQALRVYREKTGIDAKLVVLGMTATQCSIADPTDPGMLDVVGFDTAVPQTVADFARGF